MFIFWVLSYDSYSYHDMKHCDFYWAGKIVSSSRPFDSMLTYCSAADAVEWCFEAFVEDIEKTRDRDV